MYNFNKNQATCDSAQTFLRTNVFTRSVSLSESSSCLSLPWYLNPLPNGGKTSVTWSAMPSTLGEPSYALWWASSRLGGSPTILSFHLGLPFCHLAYTLFLTVFTHVHILFSGYFLLFKSVFIPINSFTQLFYSCYNHYFFTYSSDPVASCYLKVLLTLSVLPTHTDIFLLVPRWLPTIPFNSF